MKRSKFPYLVLFPVLALLILFIVVPIIGSFVIAFMDYNPLRQENSFIGFANFAGLLQDTIFTTALGNTLVYVFFMVGINLVFTLIIAQVLCSLNSNKWRSLFRVMLFMPCVAPLVAVSIVWLKAIFPTSGGLLNRSLGLLGIAPINWIGNASMLMPSLILLSLWADIGYNTILFISGIQGIPTDYYEAAEIDGAGPLRRFFNITLPLLARTFSYVCAMTLISQFQAFAQFSIIAKEGGINRAGYVLSTYIYNVGFQMKNMGYASAISVVLFLVIMLVTIVQQRMNRVDWGY